MKQYNSFCGAVCCTGDSAKGIYTSLILQPGRHILFVIVFTIIAFFLSACTTTYAPVEKRSIKPYKSRDYYTKSKYSKRPKYYTVRKGDTLFSIAWNYGLDYKSLAKWNNISPPYTIYAGNKLRLKTAKTADYTTGTKSKKNQSNKLITTTKHTATKSNSSQKNSQNRKKNKTKKAYTVTTVSTSTAKYNKKKTVKANSGIYSGNKQLRWSWPVAGKILQRYAPKKGKKGIDIGAKEGTLIKAAESGKIVYSGQGLRGYGLLLIIKHNENFLSAYAHNQSLLVNEGQVVKKGQAIARLGNTGTDRNKLHFEIRKNGQPVNPLSYLP